MGLAELYQFMEKDGQYFLTHKDELIKNYDGEYIAIRDGVIIAHAKTWSDIVNDANRKKVGRVYIEKVEEDSFMEKSDLEILLPIFE